jgi:hypothetical protein
MSGACHVCSRQREMASDLGYAWADETFASLWDACRRAQPPSGVESVFEALRDAVLAEASEYAVPSVFPLAHGAIVAHAKQGRLVRCLGMVQDVHSEHTFLSVDGDGRHVFGAAVGAVTQDADQDVAPLWCRCSQLYLIPVPGHTYAAADLRPSDDQGTDQEATAAATRPNLRRARDETADHDGGDDDAMLPEEIGSSTNADCVTDSTAVLQGRTTRGPRAETQQTREAPGERASWAGGHVGVDAALDLPYAPAHSNLQCGLVCLLPDGCFAAGGDHPLRPNDVVEVFAYLVQSETGAAASADDDDGELPAWRASMLPSGLVKTAVVAACRRIPFTELCHGGRYLSSPASTAFSRICRGLDPQQWFTERRQRAIATLAQHVNGDDLVAEYLLLHLTSCVLRRTQVAAVGCLPLSVGGVPDPQELLSCVRSALPSAVTMAVQMADGALPKVGTTTSALRGRTWVPTYCFHRNTLQATPLQLPECGSHLLIVDQSVDAQAWEPPHSAQDASKEDFTHRNRQRLAEVQLHQQLDLDYVYSSVAVNTDLSVLIVTGHGSAPSDFIPCLVSVPVVGGGTPRGSASHVHGHTPSPSMATAEELREFVAVAKQAHRASVVEMPEPTEESRAFEAFMAADLVASQRAHPEMFRETSLVHMSTHNVRMTVVRAIASSTGRTSITPAAWEHMKRLESRRFERLKAYGCPL